MKTEMRVSDPDQVEVSLRLTMTLGEWKKLRSQFDADKAGHEPCATFTRSITDAIAQVQQAFVVPESEAAPAPVQEKSAAAPEAPAAAPPVRRMPPPRPRPAAPNGGGAME